MEKADHQLFLNIEKEFNKAVIRKILTGYMGHKGFVMEEMAYPPSLQDLVAIPELADKVEVYPYLESIDLNTGMVKVGWYLFALGNKRLDLGVSTHQSVKDLEQSVHGNFTNLPFRSYVRHQDVFDFVVERLGDDRAGQIEFIGQKNNGPLMGTNANSPLAGPAPAGSSGFGYEKPNFVN